MSNVGEEIGMREAFCPASGNVYLCSHSGENFVLLNQVKNIPGSNNSAPGNTPLCNCLPEETYGRTFFVTYLQWQRDRSNLHVYQRGSGKNAVSVQSTMRRSLKRRAEGKERKKKKTRMFYKHKAIHFE